MGKVVGKSQYLRASQRKQLDKLASRRSTSEGVIEADLARRAGAICAELESYVALLLSRDGDVEYVIVGSKDRVYLPDLGRYRLDPARLRRLRLVVFVPESNKNTALQPQEPYFAGPEIDRLPTSASKKALVDSPLVATDLLTDLEKLRLDSLLVISVAPSGELGGVSLAYLVPRQELSDNPRAFGKGMRPVMMRHFRSLHAIKLHFLDFVAELEAAFAAVREVLHDTAGERAVLVCAYTGSTEDAQESLAELRELARTAGVAVVDEVSQRRKSIDPRTVIGKGKVEELVLHCLDLGADILIFDRELSPGQLRNISSLTELRVIDRSMLILDIFAQRAVTSEGRLQVELAQLRYSLPRLSESNTGLSRLTGGIGGRGPGETKLEIGRRRARERIQLLEKKIETVAAQRELRRYRRKERGVPVIAIVGYTNAGKSTLLNALTKGDVFVENKLFATLDTASKRMRFPNEKEVLFVDTVGFIRELPKELVNAFRATLEEVLESDVLLHLVDATAKDAEKHIAVVRETLAGLGVENTPEILALNKIDRLSALEVSALARRWEGIPVSALSRAGLADLVRRLQEEVAASFAGQDPGRFAEIPPWEDAPH